MRLKYPCAAALAAAALAFGAAPAFAASGGISLPDGSQAPSGGDLPTTHARSARLQRDGRAAAPASAPNEVKLMIAAANRISRKPYRWGGGHGNWRARGYDCSGAVSYVLHGAGLLRSPLTSGSLARWGERGSGDWVTVYANGGHTFIIVAGLRFDTGWHDGGRGPRWSNQKRPTRGLARRHPQGL